MAHPTTIIPQKVSWVSPPDKRGTISIIWSCFLVLFTCTWSVLHTNLPKKNERLSATILRKVRWAVWAVFAPEDVTLLAACQWTSARSSRDNMKRIGCAHWTTTHGFFADSGGFLLYPPDSPPFPVNSRAIYYLVSKGYLDAPGIKEEELWEKSKTDRLGKVVALTQSSYLVVQTVARAIQSLEVTCLEIITMAFLCCTVATYYFWVDKVWDAGIPLHLEMRTPMATVLCEAGSAAKAPYDDTPMDFVEQPGWRFWRRRKVFKYFGGLSERPIQRIPNDYIVTPTLKLAFCTWAITVIHAAVHVAGWNFDLPTKTERYLWQAASLCLLADLFGWGLVEVLSIKPGFNYTVTLLGIWEKKTTKNTLWRSWALDGPAIVCAVIYFLAKTILIVVTFTSMRLMDSSAYETVRWTSFMPHF